MASGSAVSLDKGNFVWENPGVIDSQGIWLWVSVLPPIGWSVRPVELNRAGLWKICVITPKLHGPAVLDQPSREPASSVDRASL